jgi:hypothetical protein
MTTLYKLTNGVIQTVEGDMDIEAHLADGWTETKPEEFVTRENELKALESNTEDKISELEKRLALLEAGT